MSLGEMDSAGRGTMEVDSMEMGSVGLGSRAGVGARDDVRVDFDRPASHGSRRNNLCCTRSGFADGKKPD